MTGSALFFSIRRGCLPVLPTEPLLKKIAGEGARDE